VSVLETLTWEIDSGGISGVFGVSDIDSLNAVGEVGLLEQEFKAINDVN
jgi:hypothetical protein